MLWKKESNKSDSLYVDFCALHAKEYMNAAPRRSAFKTTEKSDVISVQKRVEGNQLFGQCKWADAMEMYNESLCYAENGSTNISLAYANRASCFLKMELYNECLTDIELAKAAGYPADLEPKLDRRKEQCLKGVSDGAKPFGIFEPALSFQPNEQFPSIANVLKLERNANDYSVVAEQDIDVGQIIAVEKAFLVYSYIRYGLQCSICFKRNANLLPCKKCTAALFCCNEC
ncbi:SET and MYND domain-containing protein 4-like [Sitodiplosis mosellana]|uniref:SET and MYND domain-containing protein 4-like n=1 Tax=Sitodiplosis mosellana TaxID=263140 RepID=UPI00244526A3|nr:SET and MYND domain-containing protein 4-like [Sitodiplosis mosellana]XP_055297295.1 SET and MYND domain-containing protein 4-like [Sitodiplosis mosellana]